MRFSFRFSCFKIQRGYYKWECKRVLYFVSGSLKLFCIAIFHSQEIAYAEQKQGS
ncbi:MAG: hypothetical protein J6W29_04260 [Neisseriaceae bacterium]|nr:hypothetical protein [Neisseriaceae bacterium]